MTRQPQEVIAGIEEKARKIVTEYQGSRTVWRIFGEGPPLVLLHGGHGAWTHWVRNISHLSATRTVLAADMPGYGDSDDLPTPHSLGAIADRVGAGMEQLLTGQRYDLVGFSFGTYIAGALAQRDHGKMSRVVLVGTNGFALGVPRMFVPDFKNWKKFDTPEGRREAHRHNLQVLMIADAAQIDELAIHVQSLNTAATRVRSIDLPHVGILNEYLKDVSVPVTWVWGERDVTVQEGFAKREALIRKLYPTSSMHVIPNAGHWVPYEAPAAFNALLDKILVANELAAGAPG